MEEAVSYFERAITAARMTLGGRTFVEGPHGVPCFKPISGIRMYDGRRGTSDFRVQISEFRFQSSDFRLQISDFRFQISDFRFQISDFRL